MKLINGTTVTGIRLADFSADCVLYLIADRFISVPFGEMPASGMKNLGRIAEK